MSGKASAIPVEPERFTTLPGLSPPAAGRTTEAGLRALPGIGAYTARALQVLAFEAMTVPPQDVNIARVTARAALGKEPSQVRQASLEEQLAAGRPRRLSPRAYTYALFDAGALHCRATPRCQGCPVALTCASHSRLAHTGPPKPARSPRFRGSTRELRGAVLRAMLADRPPQTIEELHLRAGHAAAGRPADDVAAVLDALVRERLVSRGIRTSSIT